LIKKMRGARRNIRQNNPRFGQRRTDTARARNAGDL
jgi:hypothetical protein